MKLASAFAVSAVLAMTIAPAGAGDSNGGARCGSTPAFEWRHTHSLTQRTCHFEFKGFPIVIKGTADGPLDESRIRVWVDAEYVNQFQSPVAVTILECSATDAEWAPVDRIAKCSAGLPSETTQHFWPTDAKFLTLTCRVDGYRSGTHECISGLGT